MVKFIKYGTESKIEFRSVQALSMGGVSYEDGSVTMYAPRLPPLRVQTDDPRVAESLCGIIVGYIADKASLEGFPGVVGFGLDLNIAALAIAASIQEATEDSTAEDRVEAIITEAPAEEKKIITGE